MWRSLFLEGEGGGGGGAAVAEQSNPMGVSIEDMETQIAEATKEPEKEPEKKPDDSAFAQALRISEDARIRAEERLRAAPAPAAAPTAAQPDPVEMLTDDQIAKIAEEKGLTAALRIVQAQTFKLAERHLNTRLEGMQAAGSVSAENAAKAKYPMEFELFGDEIKKIATDAPDKSQLANANNWDSIIAYVRGKEGNLQKYVTRLAEDGSKEAEKTAKANQRETAGTHAPSGGGRSTGGISAGADGFFGLDATEREIADKLGRKYKDYAAWKRVG